MTDSPSIRNQIGSWLFIGSLALMFLIPLQGKSSNLTDSLRQVLESGVYDTNRVNALNKLGHALRYKDDSALVYLEEAASLSKSLEFMPGLANASLYLGVVHRRQGRYDQAMEKYLEGVLLFDQLQMFQKLGICYNDLGICYKRVGRYQQALSYYQKSLAIDSAYGTENDQSISLNNIGSIHYHLGDYQQALEYYYASLEIKNRMKDSLGIAASYNNIGLIHDERGQLDKAIDFYQQAAGIYARFDKPAYRAICVNNIGVIHYNQRDFEKALAAFSQSLEIRREQGDRGQEAGALNNLGLIYEELGSLQQAQDYYEEGLRIHEELGEQAGIAQACNSLGSFFLSMNKPETAKPYLERALKISTEIGQLEIIKSSTENLARCFARMGNYDMAYGYQQKFDIIKDSINSQNLQMELAAQEFEFNLNYKIQQLENRHAEKEEAFSAALGVEKRFNRALLAGFLLVTILLGILFYLYRSVVRSKKALRLQKTRHSDILDRVNDIIYRADFNGDFTYVNPKALALVKFDNPEDMIGLNVFDFIREDFRDEARKFYQQQLLKRDEKTYFEFPLKRPDGEEMWLAQNVQAIVRNNRVREFVAVARDITDLRMAREQVVESEKRFRNVFEVSPDPILVCSQEGNILDVNPAACGMNRKEHDELCQLTIFDLLPEDIVELDMKVVYDLLQRKRTKLETYIQNNLQQRIPVGITSSSFYYQGAPSILLQMRDITAIKEAEKTLIEARNTAVANEKAKEEFLANMSHEIRTPIHGIIGMVHLLQETNLTAEQREYLEHIDVSGDGLMTIINDILDFSKLSAGKVEIIPTVVEFKPTISRILFPFQPRAEQKGLQLETEFDPEIPEYITLDPHRIQQILNNLVGNAMKFTREGYIKVCCEKIRETEDEIWLRLVVKDSGIGIPSDKQQLIFESFSQAESDTSRKYGGTGLGLSITNRLVHLMEGKIWLESEKGQGSAFFIEIPTSKLAQVPSDRISHDKPLHAQNLNGIRVLVAEDNAISRLIIEKMLEGWGCSIALAETGREAVEKVKTESFDVVLMDVQMPEMDGRSATAFIRNTLNISPESLPIIALSAHAIQSEIDKCFECGMTDYVTKPIPVDELKEKLLHIWEHRASA